MKVSLRRRWFLLGYRLPQNQHCLCMSVCLCRVCVCDLNNRIIIGWDRQKWCTLLIRTKELVVLFRPSLGVSESVFVCVCVSLSLSVCLSTSEPNKRVVYENGQQWCTQIIRHKGRVIPLSCLNQFKTSLVQHCPLIHHCHSYLSLPSPDFRLGVHILRQRMTLLL